MSPTDEDGRLVLGIHLRAAKRLEDPGAVVEGARAWSSHVGLIARDPREAKRFADTNGITDEFFTGTRGLGESLALVRRQFAGDRFVLVGGDDDARRLAERTGWEHISLAEAAEKAGWPLDEPTGFWDRIGGFWRADG